MLSTLLTVGLLAFVNSAPAGDLHSGADRPVDSAESAAEFEDRRHVIYRILRGAPVPSEAFGALAVRSQGPDSEVSKHLWRVAGSLAASGWNPPRVTIEVVVREFDSGD